MKRFKLTKAAKILIFIIVAAIIATVVTVGLKSGLVSNDIGTSKPTSSSKPVSSIATNKKPTAQKNDKIETDVINLSLDEWIGWKSIIDANGGLTTADGSIFDELGLDVNIHIINDANQSSNALISGDLNAAGYTLNRTAFLSDKFTNAGIDVVMPVFTNYSSGGDGIIAGVDFANVESWENARIGVPSFSEAETLVAWFVDKSDLSEDVKNKIMSNLIFFDTPDDAAKAYFAGQIDVAATWEPYLSQAEASTNSCIVFDTSASSTLIMDGIVFRSDWATAHPDKVSAFIDGILKAKEMYTTEFNYIRNVMPMFSTSSDAEIVDNCSTAKLASFADNKKILNETAPSVWNDMCDIWETLGESVNRSMVDTIFDVSYLTAIESNYALDTVTTNVAVSQEQKDVATDYGAMLTKSCTVEFVADTAKFLNQSDAATILNEFIDMAKTLDGTIIQIEGNINAQNATEAGVQLSYNRAKTVANYFSSQGIDANRIIVIGNGNSKMIGDINTEEGKIKNRRVDVMFKRIEG